MGLIWTPVESTQDFAFFIHLTTGLWPKTLALTSGAAAVSGATYATHLDISCGPYILYGVRNDPDVSTGDVDIKVTIDGSLVIEKTALSPTGDNYLIGLYFDGATDVSVAPVFARSSIKIEARESASGAQGIDWLYCQYEL